MLFLYQNWRHVSSMPTSVESRHIKTYFHLQQALKMKWPLKRYMVGIISFVFWTGITYSGISTKYSIKDIRAALPTDVRVKLADDLYRACFGITKL